jgi:hypothetical protein
MNHPKLKSVQSLNKYRIQILFDDGTTGVLDLSDLAGKGAFMLWDEDDNFNKVFINEESGAITWPGNLDIDTLTAWLQVKGVTYDEYKLTSQKKSHALR